MHHLKLIAAASVAIILAACGGSNSDDGGGAPASGGSTGGTSGTSGTGSTGGGTTTQTMTVSGTVAKGPAVAGQVCVYRIVNGAPEATSLKCSTIGTDGAYSLQLAVETADLFLEASGVQYLDEANKGALTSLPGKLRSVIAAPAANATAVATISALTTLAYESLSSRGAVNATTYAAEAAKVAKAFGLGVDLLKTTPSFNATAVATNAYAQALAAVAQYSRTNAVQVDAALKAIGQALASGSLGNYQTLLTSALAAYCGAAGLTGCPTIDLGAYSGGTSLPPSGTGICRVTVTGSVSVTAPGVPGGTITTPINATVCLTKFPSNDACSSALNSGLNFSQLLQQVPGIATGSLSYAYSSPSACSAGDLKFDYNNGSPVAVQ